MSRVDWDLLAEHLGGALAGTPEEARVAHLVATDPAWAGAAARLREAFEAVSADLRAVPPAPAMPDDVAARLEAALRSASTTALAATPSPRPASPARPDGRPAGHPARSASGPGRQVRGAGRRRTNWGAVLAVAAGVVAFAAIGVGPLGLLDGLGGDDAESAGSAADEAPAPALAEEGAGRIGADRAGGLAKISSGAEYAPGSPLFLMGAAPAAPEVAEGDTDRSLSGYDDGGQDGAGQDGAEEDLAATPPPPLDRIWAEPGPCLAAVADVHEPQPVTVHRMDFASFEGEPAVVIWITTGDSAEWVWVAGPACGTPEAGPDGRYQTKVR